VENKKIIESFSSGRCPVCALLQEDEYNYLCHWVGASGEKYKYSDERFRLLKLNGFCNYHFWRLERINTYYGSARICVGLIEKIIDDLQNQKDRLGANCPVCEDLKANESEHIKELISLLDSRDNRRRYAEGWGVCIPHLMKALTYTNSDNHLASFLVKTEKKQLERVKVNALELIRKRHSSLRWQQTDDEKNSWFRAIEKLVGRRGQKND